MPHEPMCITIDDEAPDPRSLSERLSALQAGARELRAGQDELRASLEGIVGVLETMLAGPPCKRARRVVHAKREP